MGGRGGKQGEPLPGPWEVLQRTCGGWGVGLHVMRQVPLLSAPRSARHGERRRTGSPGARPIQSPQLGSRHQPAIEMGPGLHSLQETAALKLEGNPHAAGDFAPATAALGADSGPRFRPPSSLVAGSEHTSKPVPCAAAPFPCWEP